MMLEYIEANHFSSVLANLKKNDFFATELLSKCFN